MPSRRPGLPEPLRRLRPGLHRDPGHPEEHYDTFTSQLESANADEAGKQKSYEELMATKSQELATLKSTLENKQTTLGETSKNLADSQEEKAATQAQLDDDEAFFEDTKEACKSKADDWAE